MIHEIGKQLKRLRQARGLTQKELAAKVRGQLDYSYIGKIERGEQTPSIKVLMRISEALAVPLSYFFTEELPLEQPLPSSLPRKKRESLVLREIHTLHDDDVALILEIISVLKKHREVQRAKSSQTGQIPQEEKVAEKRETYDKRRKRRKS
ncbi:MAG: helix-turn-helix transcriptional regulator [Candidatus Tectomicrobia bacterium]|nr:helix-turn-helix transcriptional regulator [Candidatus Tectomicrobia bacterium]